MKVLLLQDVNGNKKGSIIEASEGYARNYLIPKKLAKEATAEAINAVKTQKEAEAHREAEKRKEAETLAKELKGKEIKLVARGGESGKLYGAVTGEMLSEALKAQLGVEIDKRKIDQDEPIKQAGRSQITVKLYAGVSVKLFVITTVTK